MPAASDTSIQFLKGVGPARKKLFENLGVYSIEDLFYLFPRRYEDRRTVTPISELKPGEWRVVIGEVAAKSGKRTFFNKKHVFEVALTDGKNRVFCTWFNQPYLEKCFDSGDKVVVYGKTEIFNNKLQIISPEYEIITGEDDTINSARIVPIYPLTKGLTQRYLRKIMAQALAHHVDELVEVIPEPIRQRKSLIPIVESIRQIHFPDDTRSHGSAHARVCFEEFFLFQVSVILRRLLFLGKNGYKHFIPTGFNERFMRAFPFALTGAQQKAIDDITVDMEKKEPMLRLLQGDVGSGKTLVSFFGCMAAVVNGNQAAVMVPTEILAEQHFASFTQYFIDGPFGEVRVALLTGSLKKKDKTSLYARIKAGEIDVVIGTHALLEESLEFRNLSFVTIDEQHKFGVNQRALLSSKGIDPDVLVMTATPIPRTLCLTLYGDLDISVINEKPKGRGEIKTYHFTADKAEGAYKRVAEWVKKGTQAYIVYPVIDENETVDLKAAVAMFERFKKNDFKSLRVGLVHGRLSREESRDVMEKFKKHELDILVTTTVLEVGIDVPDANIMIIENAERFGLSQLHQLRGRIGRSAKSAICILLGDPVSEEGKLRLEAIIKTTDGFRIAEQDLAIRGPGKYFGRHQHGLNELRVVDPLTQIGILEAARKEAVELVRSDPALKRNALIKQTIQKRYPQYLERVSAG